MHGRRDSATDDQRRRIRASAPGRRYAGPGAFDRAIDYATKEMKRVFGDSPIEQLVPVALIAEVAAAAFLGLEILTQNGREIDLDQLAHTVSAAVQFVVAPPSPR